MIIGLFHRHFAAYLTIRSPVEMILRDYHIRQLPGLGVQINPVLQLPYTPPMPSGQQLQKLPLDVQLQEASLFASYSHMLLLLNRKDDRELSFLQELFQIDQGLYGNLLHGLQHSGLTLDLLSGQFFDAPAPKDALFAR